MFSQFELLGITHARTTPTFLHQYNRHHALVNSPTTLPSVYNCLTQFNLLLSFRMWNCARILYKFSAFVVIKHITQSSSVNYRDGSCHIHMWRKQKAYFWLKKKIIWSILASIWDIRIVLGTNVSYVKLGLSFYGSEQLGKWMCVKWMRGYQETISFVDVVAS